MSQQQREGSQPTEPLSRQNNPVSGSDIQEPRDTGEPAPDDESVNAVFDDSGTQLGHSGMLRGDQQMQQAEDQFGAKPHQGTKHRGRD
jgi:hypothetical protein